MIAIKVGSDWLDIASQNISLLKTSPIFSANSIYGEYSDLPFVLANTPKNHALLGFPGDKLVSAGSHRVDCTVYLNNNFLAKGKLVVKSVKKNLQVYLISGPSVLSQELKSTNIRDIDWQPVSFKERMLPSVIVEMTGTEDLTVYYVDTDFRERVDASLSGWKTIDITNTWDGMSSPEVQPIVDDINDQYAAGTIPFYAERVSDVEIRLISSLFYYGEPGAQEFLVSSINGQAGWDCTNERTGETDIYDLWESFMDDCITDTSQPMVFPCMRNDDNPESSARYYINHYHPTYGYQQTSGRIVSPLYRLSYILKGVFNQIDFSYRGALWGDPWFNSLLLFTNCIYDMKRFIQWFPDMGEPMQINVGPFLPSINVNEFLRAIEKAIGVVFFIDSRTNEVQVNYLNQILDSRKYFDIDGKLVGLPETTFQPEYGSGFSIGTSIDSADTVTSSNKSIDDYTVTQTVETAAELDTVNAIFQDLAHVVSERAIYQYNSTTWVFYERLQDVYEVGDGANNAISACADIEMIDEEDITSLASREWLIPYVNQPVSKDVLFFDTTYERFETSAIKLLIYHGMQKDSEDNDYPYASQLATDYAGDPIASKSLKFNDALPVHADFKRWYTALLSARDTSMKLLLTDEEIQSITPLTILRQRDAKYVIKSINPMFTSGVKTMVDVEAYLMP